MVDKVKTATEVTFRSSNLERGSMTLVLLADRRLSAEDVERWFFEYYEFPAQAKKLKYSSAHDLTRG